ncbi:putative alpha/beta superfamily hydrolase [Chitinophaga sp. OAE865]
MRLLLAILLTVTIGINTSTAQTTPFVLGETQQFFSSILNETRTLNIYLPDGYTAAANTRYPVIYLLDGSANEDFIHIAGIIQFLTMIKQQPPAILVGIANSDRKHDFTFPTTVKKDKDDFPTTGGSEKFIRFLDRELKPYVQRHFRTNDTSTLIGQSLGGLLASEIVLKQPAMFNNYVIVSPSLWWDQESLLKQAGKLLAASPAVHVSVFVTVGKEGKKMEAPARQLGGLLKDKPGMHVNFEPLREETHLTILHNAVYKALQWLNGVK